MSKVSEISEQSWILSTFPEWGLWLNEEIDESHVDAHAFKIWWLSNMGIWYKTAQLNILIDGWAGSGKRTHRVKNMDERHQFARISGGRKTQPNLRITPQVWNPFAMTHIDAVLATHYHHDHIDPAICAAALNANPEVPFYGPRFVVDEWKSWGVPVNQLHEVRPGDVIELGDTTVHVLESYDRTVLITDSEIEPEPSLSEIPSMDERAVMFLLQSSAGSLLHAGDTHFSAQLYQIGKKYDVDVACVAFAENPPAIVDKMNASDILRTGEALNCQKLIPMHWDVWSNTLASPYEILRLWEERKAKLAYAFSPLCWLPGGSFTWPEDAHKLEYMYDRGFADHHSYATNPPYPAYL